MKKSVPNKKRVLSISYDDALLRTRHYILEQAGYEVTSSLGFAEAMEECDRSKFDLVLLGHTLPPKDKTMLIGLAKEHCGCPVLSMHKPGTLPHPEADYSVDAGEGPEAMLGMVQTIFAR